MKLVKEKVHKKSREITLRDLCIMGFILPVLIMLFVIIAKGIWPFGDRCFLRTDLYNQYLPFFSELRRKLTGFESFDYAWELGLGSNYMALFGYYLASPFNLLLFFSSTGKYLIEFMTFLIFVKIGLSGGTFTYYLCRRFGQNRISVLCFSVFYALSGYMAAYNWNIMWLDCVALAPLIVLGIEELVKEGKWKLYTVSLGLSIGINYYISIMICIFLVFYFLILLATAKYGEHRWKKIGKTILRFAGTSLLAAGLAGLILVPAICGIMGTDFSTIKFPTAWKLYFQIPQALARHCVDVGTEIKTDHWPNIYCGVGVFFLLPFYLLNKKIEWKKKLLNVLLLLFFQLSFSINVLDFLWHGLNYPDSLPARQSFLYILVLLSMCYEAFLTIKVNGKARSLISFFLGLGLITLCAVFIRHEDFNFQTFLLTYLFYLTYTAMGLAYYFDKVKAKYLVVLVLCMVVFEAGINTYDTSVSTVNRGSYIQKYEVDAAIAKKLSGTDDSFYRMEQYDRTTKNDGVLSDFKTATIFSSTANGRVGDFYKELGMDYSKVYYNYDGATPLTSALLGVKYLLGEKDDDWEDAFHIFRDKQDEVSLYEMVGWTGPAYTLPSDFQEKWDYKKGDAITAQNNFAEALGVEEPLYILMESKVEKDKISIHPILDGTLYLDVNHATSKKGDTMDLEVKKEDDSLRRKKTYKKVRKSYLMNLGYCETKDSIILSAKDDDFTELEAKAYHLNEQAMKDTLEKLGEIPMKITDYTSDSMTAFVDLPETRKIVFSIPYEKGWNMLMDGEEVEAEIFADTFLSLTLPAGTHEIKLHFHAPGRLAGVGLTAVSLMIFFFCIYAPKTAGKDKGAWQSRRE